MSGPSAPRFPGMRGYPVLKAGLATLGLRHLADLVAVEAPPLGAETDATGRACFLVADGVWLVRPGNQWRRVDRATIAQVRDEAARRFGDDRAETAVGLLDLLDAALQDEGDVLRQALLYQLVDVAGRAAGRPGAVTGQQLTDLGVHPSEAAAVLLQVQAAVRLNRGAADAAERLADLVARRRLTHAARLLTRLPANHGDWQLRRLADELAERITAAATFLAEAQEAEAHGDLDESAARYLLAARLVSDQPQARDGLLRSAIRRVDSGAAAADELLASATDEGLVLVLRRDRDRGTGVSWSVLRLYDDATDGEAAFEDTDFAGPVTDAAVEFGRSVRYVAIPMRDGLIDAVPVATKRIRHAPEVRLPTVKDTPYGIELSWRAPHRARYVRVLRSGSEVECEREGALDSGVEEGDYEYRVQCGYATSAGLVWSDGVVVAARAGRWPAPVRGLRVEAAEQEPSDAADRGLAVRVMWTAPDIGTADVAVWPYGAMNPGSDISALVQRRSMQVPRLTMLSPHTDPVSGSTGPTMLRQPPDPPQEARLTARPGHTTEPVPEPTMLRQPPDPPQEARLTARPGQTTRLLAVSTLDGRAVAGPSALVQVVPAPRGLRVSRPAHAADTALVEFGWPEPAVLVAVSWQSLGTAHRALISRSRYPTGGVPIAVDRSACQVTVEPLGRPDADLVVTAAATVLLPALPSPFRPWPAASYPAPGPSLRRRRRWWAPWSWFRRRRS